MGQAVVDLPDPLDSSAPADAVGADDLLSKLAGDEIDRLLAESDNDIPEPQAAPEPKPAPITTTTVPAVPPAVAETPTVSAVDLDAVLNTADAERAALHEHRAAEADGLQIDLGETAEKRLSLPMLLKPLVWINAPLDPWPDQIRDLLGKIGLMTLINAAAVIAYVMLFRRHH